MWQPQIEALEDAGHLVIAPDLRGFGERVLEPGPFSHLRDAEALLDGPAAVVGSSLGGRVALELVVHRPDLVERLVLMSPGFPGWEWSDETREGWAAEEAAYDAGDLGAAAEASVRLWIARPGHEVDPVVRALVVGMVLRAYEQQDPGAQEENVLDAPLDGRLHEIRCPTLVLVGEADVEDMRAIAVHVASSIEEAQLVSIAQAAHLPSLERPDSVNPLVLKFLR
jgi:pimeloyl-ACP methyl ester carboxylesterase